MATRKTPCLQACPPATIPKHRLVRSIARVARVATIVWQHGHGDLLGKGAKIFWVSDSVASYGVRDLETVPSVKTCCRGQWGLLALTQPDLNHLNLPPVYSRIGLHKIELATPKLKQTETTAALSGTIRFEPQVTQHRTELIRKINRLDRQFLMSCQRIHRLYTWEHAKARVPCAKSLDVVLRVGGHVSISFSRSSSPWRNQTM